MQALILAGGKGSRLHPYTAVLPKPLMPVGDFPILEIVLRQLAHAGVTRAILAVGPMSPLFRALLEDGSRFGLELTYSQEDSPLGTAGPLAMVLDQLDEDFLVMNGDILTTLRYASLFAFHQANHAAVTIAAAEREVKIDYGVLQQTDNHRLSRYTEKPVHSFHVSMGVYAMNREAVTPHVQPGQYLDFPELIRLLMRDGHEVMCYHEKCYWLDIGRLDDYQVANQTFEERRAEFLPGDA